MQIRGERRRRFSGAHSDFDLDTGGAQALQPAAGHPRVGIEHRDHHTRHAGLDEPVDAWWSPPDVGAGFECDVGGRVPREWAGGGQCPGLGVRLTGATMVALAHDLTVAHQDAADPRIGGRGAAAAFGEQQRAAHERVVMSYERCWGVRLRLRLEGHVRPV